MDAAETAQLSAALTSLHQSAQGRGVLKELLHADRFVALTDSLRSTIRTWMDAAASRVA